MKLFFVVCTAIYFGQTFGQTVDDEITEPTITTNFGSETKVVTEPILTTNFGAEATAKPEEELVRNYLKC